MDDFTNLARSQREEGKPSPIRDSQNIFVVCIDGSPRAFSNTNKMLSAAIDAVRDEGGLAATMVLRDFMVLHDGRREEESSLEERLTNLPEGLEEPLRLILRADAIICATPTHCFNMSGQMKLLIDWLMVTLDAPEYPLKGKVAAMMAICEEDGAQGAMEKMMSPLIHLGFVVPPFCTYFMNKQARASEGDWQATDQALVGRNVVRMARLLRGGAGDWNDHEKPW